MFVAGFIGSPAMNLRTARLTPHGATLAGAPITLTPTALAPARAANLDEVVVGVRPEAMTLVGADESGMLQLVVSLVEELGADAYRYGTLDGDTVADRPRVLRCDSRSVPSIGERPSFGLLAETAHVFNVTTGERLGPSRDAHDAARS